MPQACPKGTTLAAALIIIGCADIAYTAWLSRRHAREIDSVHRGMVDVRRDVAERYDALGAAMHHPVPQSNGRTHLRVAKHKEN